MSDEFPSPSSCGPFQVKWVRGAIAGLIVGLVWGGTSAYFVFGDQVQEPVFWLYLIAMVVSMTLTGILIGVVRKLPEFFGIFIGTGTALVLAAAFVIRSLRPTFGILLMVFMPWIGAIGGTITALLLRVLNRWVSSR
jgi:hypothetical protein